MSLVMPRLLTGALGLLMSILIVVLSRTKGSVTKKILGVLLGLAGIGVLVQTAEQFKAASWTVRISNLTPWFVLAALAIAQMALLIGNKTARFAPVFAAVSLVQLALGIYLLITRWKNLAIGEPLWLQIQLGLFALLLIDFVLLLLAALLGRNRT